MQKGNFETCHATRFVNYPQPAITAAFAYQDKKERPGSPNQNPAA